MRVSLNGTWQFRFEGETGWRNIAVPGCWEALGYAKDRPGPAWYRRRVRIPTEWCSKRVWLCFGGVSYHCVVTVNGLQVGTHTGLWDAFKCEITAAVTPGEEAEIRVLVEKPASLTHGPDSKPVPGSFPLRETLSGFLPYVWGHMFGGIWREAWLEPSSAVVLEDLCVRGDAQGGVRAEIRCSAETDIKLDVFDPEGAHVVSTQGTGRELVLAATIAAPVCWSPEQPARYQAKVAIGGGDTHAVRFGLRSLCAEGATLLLNGQPLYPRMILSWGWYPEVLHSNPGPEQVRQDLLALKAMGFNGIKFCLWVPPPYYFDIADELGILVWLELPMWLPKATDFFQKQTVVEYERIVRQVRTHPSLIFYTLGCELSREVSADFLGPLYAKIKELVGDALLRDNSGSGEAYGGLLNEFADFYDYHFYCDLQFFRPLVEAFAPRWRPVQPWLFGEYCDSDTFRDLRKLYRAPDEKPWWTVHDEHRNPQGARWQFDVVEQEQKLRQNGFLERGERLEAISKQQALLHRKVTIEFTRTYREVSGYVITGERDTPISTAGVFDDLNVLKFDPAEFKAFNQELVLSLGWDRRRAWTAGGDRVAFWDTFSYFSGTAVRAHLIASHYGRSSGPAEVAWQASAPHESPFAKGEFQTSFALQPAEVGELGIAEFVMPETNKPAKIILSAKVLIGNDVSENSWPLWVFPPDPWRRLTPFALIDPSYQLDDLKHRASIADALCQVVVATAWTESLQQHLQRGGRAVLLLSTGDTRTPEVLKVVPMPFWREAVKVIEPHPAWGDFPHDGSCDLQFYGLASDVALPPLGTPLLRRIDARTMAVHDYAALLPWDSGQLLISTLRFTGGLGDQPSGLSRQVAGQYLLSRWIHYLQGGP
jgi:hypothetical protein